MIHLIAISVPIRLEFLLPRNFRLFLNNQQSNPFINFYIKFIFYMGL